MRPFKEQFTLRGVVIGALGSVVITASSLYVALKLGALPWPIFFVALLSLFALKLFGNTNLNEANVTHTIMSAGAMVAGSLAFTIPGIYILDPEADISLGLVLVCALCGIALGLICTALIRKYFIEDSELVYPIGKAAAETLVAGDEGGGTSVALFTSMGVAGVFTVLRDWFVLVPTMLLSKVAIPGIAFGIYASPMAIAVGFMVGPVAVGVWLLGAVLGNFGIVTGGSALGLWDLASALDIRMSLGIGVMIGCGVGIVMKVVLPNFKRTFSPLFSKKGREGSIVTMRWAPFAAAAVMLVLAFVVRIGFVPSLLLVICTWIVVSMSAQSVGQAGINPMEIFGLIVLLVLQIFFEFGGIEALLIVATVTVACGLTGDIMNDFKAGHILGTAPKAQWIGEVIGGLIGAFVATAVMGVIVSAYGTDCFGIDKEFVAAQATAIASMVGGIPNMPAFIVGIVAGAALYLVGAPVMTLGLGIYLPFFLSLTIALGALVRVVVERFAPQWVASDKGTIIASGLLAGESVVGVIIAIIAVASGLAAL
ncbi:MAG: peptide transporter [Actinobacteria bacterium]|nr:peptide transporter [Actinomycetota bacterium]